MVERSEVLLARTKTVGLLSLTKWLTLFTLILISTVAFGQDAATAVQPDGITKYAKEIVLAVFGLVLLVMILVLYVGSDRLLDISAERVRGAGHDDDEDVSLIPSVEEMVKDNSTRPSYLNGSSVVKLKSGFDIKMQGRAYKENGGLIHTSTYAVKPKDFIGMSPIPKVMVEEKTSVKAGDQLFFDKKRPEIFYTAPVSGELIEVRRGEKRSIAELVILADKEMQYKDFPTADPKGMSRQDVLDRLLEAGAWPFILQRPYNVVADPADAPRDIFISGFDSAPSAANYNYTLQGEAAAFQAGVDALQQLTDGTVHLGLNADLKPCDTYKEAKGVKKTYYKGAHPAGNVGVQIHHTAPINKGETIWTVDPQHVVFIGRLFKDGRFDTRHLMALAGPEVENAKYYETYLGANIGEVVKDKLVDDHVRYISGDVLTGKQVETNSHVGFFDNALAVIEEGDFYEMFGWLLPSYARPSISPTFPWSLFPSEEFKVNTNSHGEERAFVVTGQYESVTPMDIYPQHLLKAIMARDFEKMEGFGIYEVVEEDLALCEFVCTSKVDVQEILREGLDYMREQS